MLESIQLIAPNGSPIAGALSKTGSVLHFKYSYDRPSRTGFFVFEEGSSAHESSDQLVDLQGNAWGSSEVEYHTHLGRYF